MSVSSNGMAFVAESVMLPLNLTLALKLNLNLDLNLLFPYPKTLSTRVANSTS
jgi:hypothetical protein